MKTREEQIKEMAQCMCGAKDSDICQNGCSKACGVWRYAERAITVGYRKQSGTAREILQYLYEKMGNVSLSDTELVLYLAAQYGVEVKE